jgi:tetratricopeptide (TPR) repeat protein
MHLDAAAGALKRMLLVAITQPDLGLAEVPLHDSLIRIDPYVEEWHRIFARAGARTNELTSIYRTLALAAQLSVGIEAALRSYAVTERARRRLIPFPRVDRPRMTPAVTLLLIVLHNLFWLARNRRAVAWDEGDGHVRALAAETVLAPLNLLAQAETLDVGDLIAMTELAGWALDVLTGKPRQTAVAAPAEAGASESPPAAPSALATLVATSGRQENAEIWLAAAVEAFRPEFTAHGHNLPRLVVSVAAPRRLWLRALFQPGHPFGRLRRHRGTSGQTVTEIPIDTNLADPLEVLRALKHQLIHAALLTSDSKQRHGPSFHKAAHALGLEPRRSPPWTPAGRGHAREISEKLGPYPRPGADRPEAIADELVPSVLALGTLSPLARIEAAAQGLPSFTGWANAWPGLRPFISAPQAAPFRQELVSRLARQLCEPDAPDERIGTVLAQLAPLEALPGLPAEHWFDFLASLIVAFLRAGPESAGDDLSHWRRWAQDPHAHSLAYTAGRVARVAEELAARRGEDEYPRVVWRWREIARLTLVPWLDAQGYSAVCLGYWLEGLLAGSDAAPTLTIGRRVCGFGLAEIVSLWQPSGDMAGDRMPRDAGLDADRAADLQAKLARCRARLDARYAMQTLIREARHFEVRRPAPPGSPTADRPVIATLVRYANVDPKGASRPRPDESVEQTKAPPLQASERALKHALAYRERGRSYAAKREYARAIADYNNAIKANPNDAVVYHSRGLAYAAQGNHDRAIEDFSEAVRLDPNDADAYINRGACHAIKGESDWVIADCSEAIRINPASAVAHRNRGISYAAKGEHVRAIRDYDETIRLDPKDALAHYGRGRSYEQTDNRARASADYRSALALATSAGDQGSQRLAREGLARLGVAAGNRKISL